MTPKKAMCLSYPPPSFGMPRPLLLDHWLHHILFLPSSAPPPSPSIRMPFYDFFLRSPCLLHMYSVSLREYTGSECGTDVRTSAVFCNSGSTFPLFPIYHLPALSPVCTSAPPLSFAILEAPFLCFRFITCLPSPQILLPLETAAVFCCLQGSHCEVRGSRRFGHAVAVIYGHTVRHF
jgi:hypothetical protein